MNSEAPGNSGQQYKGAVTSGFSDTIPSDSNEDNICAQTGEEFSTEFLRDRIALRRLPVITDVDNRQPNRLGLDYPNYQLVYEDLARVLGLRRTDSDSNSDLSDFAPATGYVAELENRAYPNNLSRYQWEQGGIGQVSGKFAEEIYCDRFAPGPAASPFYVVESPQACHPHGSTFSEASFPKKIKFLCSFGGRILPRPNDGKLRYVGGETRIISIRKNITWEQLMGKTYAICNQTHIIKYQLPGEDLDALISVCSDEDLHHMIEEYEELERNGGSQRLRIFLISSNEPESPTSIDGRVNQPSDADYQYVVAVNGMLDRSPQKNSTGQSLASQTSQFGNISDYNSPSFHRDLSTSAFTLDVKDCSPRSPHFGGLLSKPGSQFLAALQMAGKSSNQSPPISLVGFQPKDPKISNVELFMDQPSHVGNESIIRVQRDNSLYRDNANYVDPIAYYSNHAQAPPLVNYHHNNQNIVEADQLKNPSDAVQFHIRSQSENFVSSATFRQIVERPTCTNEGSNHFDRIASHPEELSGLLPVSNDREGFHNRMLHALSDPLLQKSDESFEDYLQPILSVEGEKTPLLGISRSLGQRPLLQGEIIDRKDQVFEYQNLPRFGIIDSCKGTLDPVQENLCCANNNNAGSDEIGRYFEGNMEVISRDKALDIKYLEYVKYQQGACSSSPELQSSECNLYASHLNLECTRNLSEQPHGLQLDMPASEFFTSQNSSMYNQYPMLETENSQPFPFGSLDLQPIDTQTDRESMLLVSNTDMDVASREEIFLPDEKPANCPRQKDEKRVIDKDSHVGHSNELCDQSQCFVSSQEIEKLEPVAFVKGPIDSVSSGTQSCSKVVSNVDEEVEAEATSPETAGTESVSSKSESKFAKADSRNFNKPIGAPAAEIEAEIHGLQIIKNADLEELQELGSGTFGTVYHGKWRGTDVAIKRIKSSCFAGRLSEQERLSKDFWREAQILSTLHHPNVVAFYGVVSDGPGGTLATVTEYMLHGSLRNVLLRKDRVLDRRKRLMIATDAAFGMEYLHLKNIVHFDLKCDNLLVNLGDPERPVCKVGDFGLSRIKRNTFVSGGVRGTLPWMAPELLDGNSSGVTEKVDVFSFGIAMWEILTGEEPYASMHCGAIIGGIVSNTLRPLIPKRCDSEWKKLMEECWSPDPTARPSFSEIANRLRIMSAAVQKKRHNLPSR